MTETRTPAGSSAAPSSQQFLSLGTGLLALTLFAVLTGIALLPFYHAVAGSAYPSVAAMQRSAPLRVVRAAHHWASALLIVLGAAYLLYGLFTGAYRRPLHAAWTAAVLLVLLFLGFQLTGHLLPWDSQAVSTAAIETGIAENAPVLGHAQAQLLRGGGDTVSPGTLTAWYFAHVALLPLALACLAALFLSQWRRLGSHATFPRAAVAAAVAVLLLAGAVLPVRLGSPGTPADYHSYTAPPEWYVLPLHALLDIAQRIGPDKAFLGTIVLPGLVVLCLLALPWLDRKPAHHPPSILVRAAVVLGAAVVLILTLASAKNMEPLTGPENVPPQTPTATQKSTPQTPLDPALVKKGRTLFDQNGCTGCHKLAGQGGAVGPPLDGESARHPDLNWQIRHLKDPADVTRGSTMPPYKQLSDSDLRALAEFLLSLK
jgi:quinol-cytochrome oxidoreductase complex cytochrome b subunit/cytochrome c551/c552